MHILNFLFFFSINNTKYPINNYNSQIYSWSSKSDSAPVRGEAYEPAGLQTQQSQSKDVAQLQIGSGGCQNVIGGSEKFLYGMVRS